MARNRAGPGNAPTTLNAMYYAQRASAGLIIAEAASQVSLQGLGYPGAYSQRRKRIASWKLVTDAVHRAGGRIFLQLWHVGRISHPSLQPDTLGNEIDFLGRRCLAAARPVFVRACDMAGAQADAAAAIRSGVRSDHHAFVRLEVERYPGSGEINLRGFGL